MKILRYYSRKLDNLNLENREREVSVATQMRKGREDLEMGTGRKIFGHETHIAWKKGHREYVSPHKVLNNMYIQPCMPGT